MEVAAAGRRAGWGVFAVFVATGLSFASLFSRVPAIRDELGVSPSELGVVLLAVSAGAVLALLLSPRIVMRVGPRRTVAVTAVLVVAGLAGAALGLDAGRGAVMAGLFVSGLGLGNWDVALNVEGVAVERRLGRSLMPRFHAGFSIGTVLGAALGAALVAASVSVTAHLLLVAVLVALIVPPSVRAFLPAPQRDAAPAGKSGRAWRERRTLLLGAVAFTAGLAEGTGNDWLALAFTDDYGTSQATGSAGLAVFVTAMTAGRLAGPALIDRWGRVAAVRATCVLGIAGVLATVLGPSLAVGLAGVAAWGVGVALGIPVAMSAAGDEPGAAVARVGVVAVCGYAAFLSAPPLVGFVADRVGVLDALSPAVVLLAAGALLAGACRPVRGG
jgi:fucose permease